MLVPQVGAPSALRKCQLSGAGDTGWLQCGHGSVTRHYVVAELAHGEPSYSFFEEELQMPLWP